MWRLLSAFEQFLSVWEAMTRDPELESVAPAIQLGVDLMTHYYNHTDDYDATVVCNSECSYIQYVHNHPLIHT